MGVRIYSHGCSAQLNSGLKLKMKPCNTFTMVLFYSYNIFTVKVTLYLLLQIELNYMKSIEGELTTWHPVKLSPKCSEWPDLHDLGIFLFFKFLEDIGPFCGATNTPILDFW